MFTGQRKNKLFNMRNRGHISNTEERVKSMVQNTNLI